MAVVLVSGALANKPLNGGNAWTRLSWLAGFRKLGFDAYFVEQIRGEDCADECGAPVPFEASANVAFFRRVVEQAGLERSAALVLDGGERCEGLDYASLLDVAEAADLLVNIGGHLTLEPLRRRLRRRVYLDDDPGFTQFWHASGNPGPRLDGHDFYFTIGENIGTSTCSIPTGDVRWRRTRPPVVLADWPVSQEGAADRFTTVGSWRGPYGPVEYGGRTFGLKAHEFRKFVELPERAPGQFELALDIHPSEQGDIERLRLHGWHLVDPHAVAGDPIAFRRYVQASGAEFSVAQGIYVDTESGWFSDRTVRYLASGKPALVQETGFSRNLPAGTGLVAFRTLAEAIAGADRIRRDYDEHARAARTLAEEHFDAERVVGRLLAEVGVAP